MALQIASFLSGKDGHVVYYKRGNTYCLRPARTQLKQTAATQLRSRNFGIAAGAARTFRQLLLPVLPFPKDKKMQSRFGGAMAKWLGSNELSMITADTDLSSVHTFSFNEHTSTAERCRVNFTCTQSSPGEITLDIPAFVPEHSIAAPANTSALDCTFVAACVRITDGEAMGSDIISLSVPYDDVMIPAQTRSFSVAATRGCLVIVAAAITYRLSNGKKEMRPVFLPSSVVDAWYVD